MPSATFGCSPCTRHAAACWQMASHSASVNRCKPNQIQRPTIISGTPDVFAGDCASEVEEAGETEETEAVEEVGGETCSCCSLIEAVPFAMRSCSEDCSKQADRLREQAYHELRRKSRQAGCLYINEKTGSVPAML